MDQQSFKQTSRITSIIYLLLAILLLPMSIMVVISADGLVLLGGLVMLLTGISCLVAFIRGFSQRAEITAIEQKHIQVSQSPVLPEDAVSWQLNTTEWNHFLNTEKARRTKGLLFESGLIIIVGSVILIFSRPVNFQMSLFFSFPIAVIYYLIKYRTLVSKLPKIGDAVRIIITPESAAFNQTIYPLNTSGMRVAAAKFIKTQSDLLLEVRYEWKLRKGGFAFEEIRIPVPQDAVQAAERAIELLTGFLHR